MAAFHRQTHLNADLEVDFFQARFISLETQNTPTVASLWVRLPFSNSLFHVLRAPSFTIASVSRRGRAERHAAVPGATDTTQK